ncbi:MAG: NAD(P)H-dependent oxidoreductase [Oscillospiraceae bacterium]|nr:NAD(P)H-dependent oxidoreductase [Oscillospiraceae bacterium]
MVLNVCAPPLADRERQSRLDQVLNCALACQEVQVLRRAEELDLRPGDRVLFALALDGAGQNPEYQRMLARLRLEPGLLEGCTGGLIVDGPGELYTKSTAAELALAMNSAGCALVGRPLVEATGSLSNFRIQAKNLSTDLMGAYQEAVRELAERLRTFTFPGRERPRLLALHASSHHTSNTMALWAQVQSRLSPRWEVEEVGLRNGTLSDCSGCPYTMCLHFGERGGCFYGGVMQEAVYPAVRRADALILMCPNYNDALSANLSAFINRLTALFRQTRFYEKAVFALVVSGYSGSDTVARQLISALNMNKSFYLPPCFALMETANAPGEALAAPGIESRLDRFVQGMEQTFAFRI